MSEGESIVGNLVAYLGLDTVAFTAAAARAEAAYLAVGTAAERAAVGVNAADAALDRTGAAGAVAAGGLRETSGAALGATAASNDLAAAQARAAATARTVGATSAGSVAGVNGLRAAMGGLLETAAKLGLLVGAFEAVKIGLDLVKEGNAFTQQMLQIQTMVGASAAEVKELSNSLLNMASSVGQGPEDLALSLYHIKAVGLDAAESMKVLETAAKGAKVGNADLEETTNALTSTVASGIPGVDDFNQAMGALVTIVGSGDMKLSDLNKALGGGILTVVKGYGLSLLDVGAALATFGDNNIRGANAATMLRMAVQSLAVPAVAGIGALNNLGLGAHDLAVDMQEGGLNQAIKDLKLHLDASGVSAVQTGAVLTEIFGKRAGPGLAVLIAQFDRLQTKYQDITEGAEGFGDAWEARTHTVGFAFDRLWTQAQVAGVRAFQAISPALGEFLYGVGTAIPAAASAAQQMLSPMVSEISVGLIPALRTAGAVAGAMGAGIGEATAFLVRHKEIVQDIVVPIAAMWLAFKAYGIATAAVSIVGSALETLALKAMYASDTVAASSIGMNLALGAVGVAVVAATLLWQRHAKAQAEAKAETESYTQALKDDGGAIGEHARQVAANELGTAKTASAIKELGLSWHQLTDAALGNKDALSTVNDSLDKTIDAYKNATAVTAYSSQEDIKAYDNKRKLADAAKTVKDVLGDSNSTLADAQAAYAALDSATEGATVSTQSSVDATASAIQAMNEEKQAADDLAFALDTLDKNNLSLDEAQTHTQVGILGLAKAHADMVKQIQDGTLAQDDNLDSLSMSTAVGLENRQVIQQRIDAILSEADAMTKSGASTDDVTARVAELTGNLQTQAGAAGYNSDQIKAMTDNLLAVPAHTPAVLDVSITGVASLTTVLQQIHDAEGVHNAYVTLSSSDRTMGIPGQAIGGPVRGPGTSTSDSILRRLSNGEFVVNAATVARVGEDYLNTINSGGPVLAMPSSAAGTAVNRPAPAAAFGPAMAAAGSDDVVAAVNANTAAIQEQTAVLAQATYGAAAESARRGARNNAAGSSRANQ